MQRTKVFCGSTTFFLRKVPTSFFREYNRYWETRDNEEGRRAEVSSVVPQVLSHILIFVLPSDIRLLAVSTHMTELSYAISDIQTRIFGA
jgi:hypothetical protein